MASETLIRPRDDRMIAGVCAMAARRFGWQPRTARILAVVGLFVFASTIPVYIALWLIVPSE
jgi:phage shock protein PspC (stress-responsive transcriptional regulator)